MTHVCKASFFFFSSRRRHTRLQGDWSSDVCSSDLIDLAVGAAESDLEAAPLVRAAREGGQATGFIKGGQGAYLAAAATRSEERRVGKECRSRWSPYH